MKLWTQGWTKGQMNGWMDDQMDRWIDRWTDGRREGEQDGWTGRYECRYVSMRQAHIDEVDHLQVRAIRTRALQKRDREEKRKLQYAEDQNSGVIKLQLKILSDSLTTGLAPQGSTPSFDYAALVRSDSSSCGMRRSCMSMLLLCFSRARAHRCTGARMHTLAHMQMLRYVQVEQVCCIGRAARWDDRTQRGEGVDRAAHR